MDKSYFGKVYLVGAGPGHSGLLTLKGHQLLQEADVVVYDRLVGESILAMIPPRVERIDVGKLPGDESFKRQIEINQLLVKKAKEGKKVVRLKGGDPFLFGRGGEEALYLGEEGISFEVVPGVSAALGVSAYAGIPLTHRGMASSVVFLTGHEDFEKETSAIDWQAVSRIDTIVIYMGVSNLPKVVQSLLQAGKLGDTPVALVQSGTTASQRILIGTLQTIVKEAEQEAFRPPMLTLIGEVVRLAPQLNWVEKKPLFGRRIVVTRSREQASAFSTLLESYGAEVFPFPVIRFEPLLPQKETFPLQEVERVDWLVFTSANAVSFFVDWLKECDWDIRLFHKAHIATIGPATREKVASLGLHVSLSSKEPFQAEDLVQAFSDVSLSGKKVLIPRAEEARSYLEEALLSRGASVSILPLYRTVCDKQDASLLEQGIEQKKIDLITFTSSSTVKNFLENLSLEKAALSSIPVGCIGEITAETAKQMGLKVAFVSKRATLPDFAQAVVHYFRP